MSVNAIQPALNATNAASKLIEPPVTQPQKKTVYCVQAVSNQDFPLLRQLLKDGADVNAAPEGTGVPLERAVVRGNVEMTKFLLQQGAKLDNANMYGCTALHVATFKNILPVAYVLLEAGADTKLKTKNGNTALDLAQDDAAKSLLTIYASGGRPSWLAQELYQRGLAWDVIAAVDAKMQKEGFKSRELMSSVPLTHFTETYLKEIGIEKVLARQVLIQVRLESTWLGCELAKKGVNAINMALCEKLIIDEWSRTSEALFASLKTTDLTSLPGITARHVYESLKELHREVNRKHQKVNKKSLPTAAPHTETKTKPKPKTKTKPAIAVSNTVPATGSVAAAPTAVVIAPSVSALTPSSPVSTEITVEAIPGSEVKSSVQFRTSTTAAATVPLVSHQPIVEPVPTGGAPADNAGLPETGKCVPTVPAVQRVDAGSSLEGVVVLGSKEEDGERVDSESESEGGTDERDSGTWEHL